MPPMKYCGDNGAMIAWMGQLMHKHGLVGGLEDTGVIQRYRTDEVDVPWSESSAVCYANSVLGARTNREGGPGALSAAICGKTAEYGYHLDAGRRANLLVDVDADLKGSDYGALGYIVGKTVGDGVPYFKLQNKPILDELKLMGAALASSGAVALYHVEGITPEYKDALLGVEDSDLEKMSISASDIAETREKLSTSTEKPDLICLGCPHERTP